MPAKRETRGENDQPSDLELLPESRHPAASAGAPLNSEQILDAILYLDADLDRDASTERENQTLLRCVGAVVALLYLAMFLWIRHWLR
jgi:hypothetical protein